ncbi:CRISPR-associated protein Cas4 [Litoribacterium kuwaitense]|uniref:CRISPR-associated protein Cas4 n=1 Tax=Litoribacterium kuwaitense TaxID=1398745 RepID=UPI001BA75BC4|nr:CRISPR-associated protein Cas4 [Litoribacterium kuwaitense]
MEHESDRVLEGKILHEESYPRLQEREVLIDNAFKMDHIDGKYVREVKMSSKMQESDHLQMLFYLYQLELRGVQKRGLISYTKEKKTVEVILDNDERAKVKRAIAQAYRVIEQAKPPVVKKLPYCKSCAYFGFCYVREADEYAT